MSPVHFLFTGRDRKERARCTFCSQGEIERKEPGALPVHRERYKGKSPVHFQSEIIRTDSPVTKALIRN
jgi:hypothetical protein